MLPFLNTVGAMYDFQECLYIYVHIIVLSRNAFIKYICIVLYFPFILIHGMQRYI